MAQLSDEKLFLGTLPEAWRPLLELLGELDLLVAPAKEPKESLEARRQRAGSLRDSIIQTARHFSEDLPPTLRSSSPEYRRWFTEAALLWPEFAEAGGTVLVDTIPTAMLARYPVDLAPTDERYGALRRALGGIFGWTDEELRAIEAKLRRLTANLRLKKALTRSLCKAFPSGDAANAKALAAKVMREIYGDVPWRTGDVDLVVTTSAVFLCLPYEGTSLTGAAYAERPDQERHRITAFLERVHAEQQNLKSVRFPAFGIFDASVVAPSLISRLTHDARQEAEFSDVDEATVSDTFATMVTVLPTHDVEKFLVHDVWGHGWQQTLCEFEWKFRELSSIVEPLGQARGARFAASGPGLAEAFETRDGKATLRPDVLLRVVEADLRERIVLGMNLVVSENLADLIEHKFSRSGYPLPSSSLLPDSPLRVDLSLADARLMLRAWRKPYRRLIREPSERLRLQGELERCGVDGADLLRAIEQAASLIDRTFGLAFDDKISVSPATGEVRVNVLERIMLGVMTFDAAIDRLLADGEARWQALVSKTAAARWQCPAACIDFLALLLAWFYEQERDLNVWHLDELVATEMGPTLERLEQALLSEGAEGG